MTGRLLLGSFTALALVIAAAVPATSDAVEVRPVFRSGIEFGGDNLVKVTTSGGSGRTSIDAGDGISIGGGVSIVTEAKDIEGQVTLSYKFAGINASNGDIDWTVLPLDALVFYRLPKFRLGGGLTYHMSPKLKGSGVVSSLNATYKDALGVVLEADYRFTQRIALGLRYTSVNYKASSIQTSTFASVPPSSAKTNALGLAFSMSF